jgi:hypothetical protein
MKKMIFSFIVLGTLVFVGTGWSNSANAMDSSAQTTQADYSNVINPDGDKICPNYDGTQPGKGKGPGNGQGVGRTDGKGLGKGKGPKDGSGPGCKSPNKKGK